MRQQHIKEDRNNIRESQETLRIHSLIAGITEQFDVKL